jgi:hypothetical protein
MRAQAALVVCSAFCFLALTSCGGNSCGTLGGLVISPASVTAKVGASVVFVVEPGPGCHVQPPAPLYSFTSSDPKDVSIFQMEATCVGKTNGAATIQTDAAPSASASLTCE